MILYRQDHILASNSTVVSYLGPRRNVNNSTMMLIVIVQIFPRFCSFTNYKNCLQVLAKWGEYSHDVQFILQRSPLDSSKTTSPAPTKSDAKILGASGSSGGSLTQPAIWKSPPGSLGKPPMGGPSPNIVGPRPGTQDSAARLSPDSGQGSDPTGSDTSNFSDQEKALRGGGAGAVARHPPSSLPPSG